MQGVNPLASQDSAFAAWNMLDRLGAEQTTLDPPGFGGRKERTPIPPRGFHRSRLESMVDEPVRQGIKSSSVRAQGTPALLVVAVGYAGPDRLGANIDPRGVSGYLAHPLEWTSCTR